MNSPTWPPEMDLLDQLTSSDMPVSTAVKIFNDSERFVGAVMNQLHDGTIEMYRHDSGKRTNIKPFEWETLLRESSEWGEFDSNSRLMFELTEKGINYIG